MAVPKKKQSTAHPDVGGGRLRLEDAAGLPATQFGGTRLKGEQGHVDKAGVVSKKSMKPGGGGRFDAFVSRLVSEGKSASSAKAIAASAGRAKYGKARFQSMAAKGRKRA